jgi:hypothetical protein
MYAYSQDFTISLMVPLGHAHSTVFPANIVPGVPIRNRLPDPTRIENRPQGLSQLRIGRIGSFRRWSVRRNAEVTA